MRLSGQSPLILAPTLALCHSTYFTSGRGIHRFLIGKGTCYPSHHASCWKQLHPNSSRSQAQMCFCAFFQNKVASASALSPWLPMPNKVTHWGQTQLLASLGLNRNPFLEVWSCCGRKKAAKFAEKVVCLFWAVVSTIDNITFPALRDPHGK